MGVCGSKPKGCVGMKNKLNLQKKRRRRRRIKGGPHHPSINRNRVEPSDPKDLAFTNPSFQGSSEAWFDPDAMIDSDGDDDEFYSVQDDVSQAGSLSNVVTPRFSNQVAYGNNTDSQVSCGDSQNEEQSRNESGSLHSCGFISNTFLPCLACDESLDVKKKPPSLTGSNTKKKLSITPSFKWKEGQENPILSLGKPILQRPIAGSQVKCSPLEKKMAECWSRIEPNIFKVRGRTFLRDKKKEFAPNYAAYVPFGVDVFLCPRKINHIARFVELPSVDSHGEIPPILVVNLQIPLYPAAIFQNEYDGPGMSFVFYFKLSENYEEDLPLHFRENIRRMIANEMERIKGFPIDTNASLRERLKILGRVVNLDDLELSATERKLMYAYNEKPVLSRPQHEFYSGENYFEIDLDIHRFGYIPRKGFETFQDRIKNCVFDFGLTLQGNKAEDLPECILCCLRVKEIDYTNYCQLSI
ncbi:hypothetical protein ABFS82_08G018500 [Erythranthe guttata]|uniref:Protein ENHANCED DISEASE RESISTANCE 2 C-terminal domain-containing protein n=2 Tax=Erythranthe guttata TaxID=4155 RepID=A0A022R1I7_ERYGU|nr:PREDICTED: uncharacterized protein LOC105961702 [Erythranthe guttata]EYU34126.1 hypothetical protein MIMGU_mgv1a005828mg [Erythranthe guttata]|eukprot:XP_012841411.1 PREDICTED: uncharacterized protein LOC105961702 [Erythranthe guttata]